MSSMDSCRLHFENARHVLNASRGRNSCECMHDCWLYNTAVRPLTYPPSCVTSCRPVSHGMRLQVKLINDMGNRVAVHDIGIGAAGAACFLLGIPETPGQRVGGDARQRTEAQVSCLCLSNNQTVQIFSVGDPLRKPHSLCKHAYTHVTVSVIHTCIARIGQLSKHSCSFCSMAHTGLIHACRYSC